MRVALPLLAAVLLPGLAAAEDRPQDLPAMQAAYGWRTVATVVSAATRGDATLGDAHAQLRELDLQALKVPVSGAWKGAHLTACGWNDAVVCRLTVPAGATPPEHLVCTAGGKDVPDAPLRLTVSQAPTDEAAGEAWIEDLLPCWRAGADAVAVRTPPAAVAPGGVVAEGAARGEALRALLDHADALDACGIGTLTWATDDAGRAVVLGMDSARGEPGTGTSCVQAALGSVRLSGEVQVEATLPLQRVVKVSGGTSGD